MDIVLSKFDNNLKIPKNFIKTAIGHSGTPRKNSVQQPQAQTNPQTKLLCERLGVDDPLDILLKALGIDDSYTSLDESQDTSVNQTFIEDSEIFESSALGESSMKLKLCLPKPKREFSEDAEQEELPEISIDSIEPQDSSGVCDVDISSNIMFIDKIGTDSPRPKKFVRRNADIYKDNDD